MGTWWDTIVRWFEDSWRVLVVFPWDKAAPWAPVLVSAIAAMAVFRITSRQAKAAETKVKLDLFDRRAKVHGAMKRLMDEVPIQRRATKEMIDQYVTDTNGVHWLFDSEIVKIHRLVLLEARRLASRSAPVEQHELWIFDTFHRNGERLDNKIARYLAFDEFLREKHWRVRLGTYAKDRYWHYKISWSSYRDKFLRPPT